MDLLALLRTKLDSLPAGDHTPGLKAILLHIETAIGHLLRGQRHGEDSAFTDVIYRTNQTFEGSVKEAYRVLANQDPSKKRPFDIEEYLDKQAVFRPRVLALFRNYRTEWRNPSTHDYKLDFDESEAFLAVTTVASFAALVLDQIAAKLAYMKSRETTEPQAAAIKDRAAAPDLLDQLAKLFVEFGRTHASPETDSPRASEAQIVGALSGFLGATVSDAKVLIEEQLTKESRETADLVVVQANRRVIVEVKRGLHWRKNWRNGLVQLEHYLVTSGAKDAILYLHSQEKEGLVISEIRLPTLGARILVVAAGPVA